MGQSLSPLDPDIKETPLLATTSESFILENSCLCLRSPSFEPLAVARALSVQPCALLVTQKLSLPLGEY